ncbi:MAG: hypothetical protein GWN58_13960, partial [Anaerolineae bacterium]|nr:hypothetical protein [Anaerolineae bacterium]
IMERTSALEEAVMGKRKPWARGCVMQRWRLGLVAELGVLNWPGDLIEIGAFVGGTTVRLAELAALYDRRVIVVDPWEDAENYYKQFQFNIRRVSEHVDVWRMSSLDEQVRERLADRQLCFAFVDGLHTYEACAHDIATVAHAPVIAVDDLRMSGVRQAFEEAPGQHAMRHFCREGYVVSS